METLGHSSRKPEEESTVETLMFEDDDDWIDGHIITSSVTWGRNSNHLTFYLGERVDILDTGNVRLILTSKVVHQEEKVETIYQAPNICSIV